MHAKKRNSALHEPTRPSNRSLPWESGAKDARTPNADASSADSVASAKRLECVRFIGAFRQAREGERFMAPMHDFSMNRPLPTKPVKVLLLPLPQNTLTRQRSSFFDPIERELPTIRPARTAKPRRSPSPRFFPVRPPGD